MAVHITPRIVADRKLINEIFSKKAKSNLLIKNKSIIIIGQERNEARIVDPAAISNGEICSTFFTKFAEKPQKKADKSITREYFVVVDSIEKWVNFIKVIIPKNPITRPKKLRKPKC